MKSRIINQFESMNDNFKISLKKEFQKHAPIVPYSEMYKYKQILLNQLYSDLNNNYDTETFASYEKSLDYIEEVLFEYLCNADVR